MTQSEFDTVAGLVGSRGHRKCDSYSLLARKAGFFLTDGQPNKMKAWRIHWCLKRDIKGPEQLKQRLKNAA